jgi:hypothetical protein
MDAGFKEIIARLCEKSLTTKRRSWREVERELRARDKYQKIRLPRVKFLEDESAAAA